MSTLWGLRGKSTLALLLACCVALIPSLLIAWQAVGEVRRHFAAGYVEQYTLLHMQRILTPISRDLVLSRRLADSVVTREWLQDPQNRERRERFFDEARGYQQELSDNAYFIVDHASGEYYYNDGQQAYSSSPRYQLSPDDPADAWYYAKIDNPAPYTIDVSQDHKLGMTKVWINVKIRQDGELLGLTGGGIDLTAFLNRYMRDTPAGLTPMIINRDGDIQAHPERQRVTVVSGDAPTASEADATHFQTLLDTDSATERFESAKQRAIRQPGDVQTIEASINDTPHLMTIGYLPELDWMLVTAIDMNAASLISQRWIWLTIVGLLLILGMLIAAFSYAINRLVLTPITRLQGSAQALVDGGKQTTLPTQRRDEIGELSRTFSSMAGRIEQHTQQLEDTVQRRTQDLLKANEEMAEARRQIDASIEYASIIQRAILPRRQLDQALPGQHGVLWQPRDTVGGDIYVFHAADNGYLLGIVDCAGHGIPGSLMTMLARAIIDNAIFHLGPDNPARLLDEIDRQIRLTLHDEQSLHRIATHVDMGLVWVEPETNSLTFAGAKMALYASDGHDIQVSPGGKRALGQKRTMQYENQALTLDPACSYTLCSDGLLDQAGGPHGFGFGHTRLHDMLIRYAQWPVDEQVAAYEATLKAYQDSQPQRDDITLMCFRFADAQPMRRSADTASPSSRPPDEKDPG